MKPIPFSTPMVQAILNGTKTQTRRVVKVKGCKPFIPDNSFTAEAILKWNKDYFPYGKPGDILWVREQFINAADFGKEPIWVHKAGNENYPMTSGTYWKPYIYMPFTACRLFLKIKSIRVERLQDITEADAKAEGVKQNDIGYYENYLPVEHPQSFKLATKSFCSLWQKINGIESWDANPFVWVIEFERTEKPLSLTT